MGKTILSLFESIGTGLTSIVNQITAHFERPTKYGYLVVDDVDRGGDYGCIVGAVYRDDGYEVQKVLFPDIIAPMGRTVIDEVAAHILNREFTNIKWLPEGKDLSDGVEAMNDEMDALTSKHDRFHTAIVVTPDLDGKDGNFIAVAYTQKLTGETVVTRAMHYNKNHLAGEEFDDYELGYIPLFGADVRTITCDGDGFGSKDAADTAYHETLRDAAGMCHKRYGSGCTKSDDED